jgi:hypothetical protein
MLRKALFIITILALLSAACASGSAARPSATQAPLLALPRAEEYAAGSSADTANVQTAVSGSYGGTVPEAKRIVIVNASLSIAVADPEASAARIQKMTKDMGGFVVSIQMSQTTLENGARVPLVYMTVRIPAEQLDEALTQVKAETEQPIISEDLNSQDVTSDYTDLQSRLRNLEAAEQQLQEIMADAIKTEDVLAVYNQLVSVREQIEVLKGQIQYYDEASALSSLSIQLQANEAVQPISIGGWQPGGIAKDAIQALINTLKALVNVSIWLVLYILPTAICVFGPLALIAWGIYAWWKRRTERRKKANSASMAPPTQAG